MHIKITQGFEHPSSCRPFQVNELVTVPDELAKTWIADGKAVALRSIITQGAHNVPARQRREKAVAV